MADEQADDEREEELSSIEAIFPELAREAGHPFCASLDIPVSPADPLAIRFPPPVDGVPLTTLPTDNPAPGPGSPPQFSTEDKHVLSHLPPLHLQITLPDRYPNDKPPSMKITTTPAWVPSKTLQELEAYAAELWEEYGHMQVVFAYIDYLQQAAERGFDLSSQGNGVLDLDQDMKIAMLDFDITTKRRIFNNETFDCGVCLEPKKGSVCYKLRKCGHVFCVECLQDVYNNAITEGNVTQVICLEYECGQERQPGERRARRPARTITPHELLQIPLQRDMVQRYVDLKRKKKLESDQNTIYCPRKWCQGPAKSKKYPKRTLTDSLREEESDSEAEDGSAAPKADGDADIKHDRLRICEECDYAFCRVCNTGWHGEFIRCWPRSAAERTEEEQASYEYIRMHTSPCPSCAVPCQKTHGCNHMNCYQCNTHFCYLCSQWLDPQNPYQHFNEEGKDCYQRLWELEEGDNAEGNVQFLGVRGAEARAIEEERRLEAERREAEEAQQANGQQQPDLQALVPIVPVPEPPLVVAVAQVDPPVIDLADFQLEDSDSDDEDAWWRPARPQFEARPAGRPRRARLPALGGAGGNIRRGPVRREAEQFDVARFGRNAPDDEVEVGEGDVQDEALLIGDEMPVREANVPFAIAAPRRRGRRRGGGEGAHGRGRGQADAQHHAEDGVGDAEADGAPQQLQPAV